ncbi:MAG: sigma-70 family RNA polymerase sigma factor [Gemmatimonadaceae bacterium]|nr:sigma-70 family RNA polymerase sigma factor [Gemmatimonadaceae bacterium]
MSDAPVTDHVVTRLLDQARHGDRAAIDQLLPLVYAELHVIAERHMARERDDHTLQPTALVHEAYVRLAHGAAIDASGRLHFLRLASQVMRRVLVDHARARQAAKRGGMLLVTLDESAAGHETPLLDLLALDDALTRLAEAEPRWAEVVALRFFAGLEITEIAETMEISTATVKRDWRFARAWLARALDGAPVSPDRPDE